MRRCHNETWSIKLLAKFVMKKKRGLSHVLYLSILMWFPIVHKECDNWAALSYYNKYILTSWVISYWNLKHKMIREISREKSTRLVSCIILVNIDVVSNTSVNCVKSAVSVDTTKVFVRSQLINSWKRLRWNSFVRKAKTGLLQNERGFDFKKPVPSDPRQWLHHPRKVKALFFVSGRSSDRI